MSKGKKGRAAHLKEAEKKSAGLERELAELKQKAAKLEYELGRYKTAVGTRNKVLADLRADLELAERKEKSNEAIVALLLKHIGADKAHPVLMEHKAVREALSGYHVLVQVDEDTETYALHFEMTA